MSAGILAPAQVQVSRPSKRRRWLLPSLSDCLFIAWIVWVFVFGQPGWSVLLDDGDTGWHIRVGESILDSWRIPVTDSFSFTKPGAPWYAWEWLSDVVYALAFRLFSLKGVTLLAGVVIALFGVLLFRYMIWRGASLLPSLAVVMLAFGASSIHFLARPHVFTFVLLIVSLWLLDKDARRRSRTVWLLAPLAALWTNLHGGFVALLACLGILAAGSAAETLIDRSRGWRAPGRYVLLSAACAAATFLNPYGSELHRHIYAYLRADWIRNSVEEFKSPLFRTENSFQFEILLFLGLMSAASLLAKRRIAPAALVLAWAHLALVSARHVPIFAIVAAPQIASELSWVWERFVQRGSVRSVRGILSQVSHDLASGLRHTSIWPAAFVALLIAAGDPLPWPRDFPTSGFPVEMISRHEDLLSRSRVFANDDWADYLLFRFHPRQRVFFDGRSDFYGPGLMKEYIAAYQGRHNWREILDKYRCDSALIPPECPLASLLKTSSGWKVVEDDGVAALFVRR